MMSEISSKRSLLMALDRDAERVLEMVRLSGRPPYETLSVSEARELFLAAREVLAADPPPAADIRALSAPGSNGAASLWLYRGRERPRRNASRSRLLSWRRLRRSTLRGLCERPGRRHEPEHDAATYSDR